MATNLLPLNPIPIRACAHRPETNCRKSSSGSASWWSPLFGWSSEPDYMGAENRTKDVVEKKKGRSSELDLDLKRENPRSAPGCFTEEKARQLRMLTSDTSSFHDAMYHSAIASRLASDFNRRSDR